MSAHVAPASGAEILARLLAVDGLLSQLDADYVRGFTPDGRYGRSQFGAFPRAGQVPRVLPINRSIAPYQ